MVSGPMLLCSPVSMARVVAAVATASKRSINSRSVCTECNHTHDSHCISLWWSHAIHYDWGSLPAKLLNLVASVCNANAARSVPMVGASKFVVVTVVEVSSSVSSPGVSSRHVFAVVVSVAVAPSFLARTHHGPACNCTNCHGESENKV